MATITQIEAVHEKVFADGSVIYGLGNDGNVYIWKNGAWTLYKG